MKPTSVNASNLMPRLRPFVIAALGPNGSGKSSIERTLGIGDEVLMNKVKHGRAFIDDSTGKLCIINVNADTITNSLREQDKTLSVDEACRIAQKQAEMLRNNLVNRRADFAFESVASHPSKVEFLRHAKSKGYYVVVLIVSTESPDINVQRVQERGRFEGNDVPEDKVRSRYYNFCKLLPQYWEVADTFIAYDNSRTALTPEEPSARLLLVKNCQGMQIQPACNEVSWIREYLLDRIS